MSVKTIQSAADKSAKALTTIAANAQKEIAALQALTETVPAMVQQAEEAQVRLDNIKSETEMKVREAKVELDMAVRENENKVLTGLMQKRGLANIEAVELETLRNQLVRDDNEQKAEIAKAVNAAVANAKTASDAVLAETVSDHKVAVAEKDATIKALTREIEFLNKTVASLENTITAEREARVAEAQARSNSQITVNNSK